MCLVQLGGRCPSGFRAVKNPAVKAVFIEAEFQEVKKQQGKYYSLLALKTPISRATKSVRNLERSRLAAFYKVGGL
jgi:hypothetical protein